MAVDLARLSLWLATLARDHEFTFLDHALKAGDSLVGLTSSQIEAVHWDDAKPATLAQPDPHRGARSTRRSSRPSAGDPRGASTMRRADDLKQILAPDRSSSPDTQAGSATP